MTYDVEETSSKKKLEMTCITKEGLGVTVVTKQDFAAEL